MPGEHRPPLMPPVDPQAVALDPVVLATARRRCPSYQALPDEWSTCLDPVQTAVLLAPGCDVIHIVRRTFTTDTAMSRVGATFRPDCGRILMTGSDGDAALPSPGPRAAPAASAGSVPGRPSKVQSVDRALRAARRRRRGRPARRDGAGLAARCDINRATAWRLLGHPGGARPGRARPRDEPVQRRPRAAPALRRGRVRRPGPARPARSSNASRRRPARPPTSPWPAQHGVTYVGEVAPPSVLAISWLAREVPLHATSTGKAYLAWLPPDEVARHAREPAAAASPTPPSPTSSELLDELARTRERGYAECAGELEPTLYGVSAPVLGASTAGRSPCSASGARSAGCRRRGSPRSGRWRSRPPARSGGRC